MTEKKRFSFRNGNGEILGFAISIFLLFFLMIGIVVFSSLTIRKEQLTVATYCAGRAAAISQTPSLGESRAAAIIKAMYPHDDCKMEMTVPKEWEIGYLFTIEVSQPVPELIPFANTIIAKENTCTLTMMVENEPALKKK